MTEKELKKLSRKQLLELLLQQTERADRLQEELDKTTEKLLSRVLTESAAGSIAEASLQLNGIFEAAQAAADQYMDNITKRADAECKKKTEEMVAEATARCRDMEAKARKTLEESILLYDYLKEQKKALDLKSEE